MGQAQSGTEEALEGHEPSRHVKVSADLLIPPNIVIDDIEMLQAVQRRIERVYGKVLCECSPPTEDEKDEECPICCDRFRDLNWFTCCKHPICSECFVRLWQERLEALDTDIACPFCKQPQGDAHLKFIKLTEKAKKARRKAEEESVHAQKRAQQREREMQPLSSLNVTAREQLMWAPEAIAAAEAAASSQAAERRAAAAAAAAEAAAANAAANASPAGTPTAASREASRNGRSRGGTTRNRSRTPPLPSDHANTSAHGGSRNNRSRSRTTARDLALEVESAVLERSYHGPSRHGSREPSQHGRREPSTHGNRESSTHGCRDPSRHGAREQSTHGRTRPTSPQPEPSSLAERRPATASPEAGNQAARVTPPTTTSVRGASAPAPAPPRHSDTSGHGTAAQSGLDSSTRSSSRRMSHDATPTTHVRDESPVAVGGRHARTRSGCLGFGLSREASRELSLQNSADASARSRDKSNRSGRFWSRSHRHGGSRRATPTSSQRGHDAFAAVNATAREHSSWAPNGAAQNSSGNLSGALSSDSRTTPTNRSSPLANDASRGGTDLSPTVDLSPVSPGLSPLARSTRNGEGSRRSGSIGASVHRRLQKAFSGALGRSRHGGSRHASRDVSEHSPAPDLSPRTHRELVMNDSVLSEPSPSNGDSTTMRRRESDNSGGVKSGTIPPNRADTERAARSAQARLNQGAALAGATRGAPPRGVSALSLQDHIRGHAQKQGSEGSAQSGASTHEGHATGDASSNPSVSSSRFQASMHAAQAQLQNAKPGFRSLADAPPHLRGEQLGSLTPTQTVVSATADSQARDMERPGHTQDDRSITSSKSSDSRRVNRSIKQRWNLRGMFSSKDKSARGTQTSSATPCNEPSMRGPSMCVGSGSLQKAPEASPSGTSSTMHARPATAPHVAHAKVAKSPEVSSGDVDLPLKSIPVGDSSKHASSSQSQKGKGDSSVHSKLQTHKKDAAASGSSAKKADDKGNGVEEDEPLLPVLKPSGSQNVLKRSGSQNVPSPQVAEQSAQRTVGASSRTSTVSVQSRKAQAEIAASPEAFVVEPPEPCSAAPMHDEHEREEDPTLEVLSAPKGPICISTSPPSLGHLANLAVNPPLGKSEDPLLPELSHLPEDTAQVSSLSKDASEKMNVLEKEPSQGVPANTLHAHLQNLASKFRESEQSHGSYESPMGNSDQSPTPPLHTPSSAQKLPEASVSSSVVLHPEQDFEDLKNQKHLEPSQPPIAENKDAHAPPLHARRASLGGSSVAESARSEFTVAESAVTVSTAVSSQFPRVRHIFAGQADNEEPTTAQPECTEQEELNKAHATHNSSGSRSDGSTSKSSKSVRKDVSGKHASGPPPRTVGVSAFEDTSCGAGVNSQGEGLDVKGSESRNQQHSIDRQGTQSSASTAAPRATSVRTDRHSNDLEDISHTPSHLSLHPSSVKHYMKKSTSTCAPSAIRSRTMPSESVGKGVNKVASGAVRVESLQACTADARSDTSSATGQRMQSAPCYAIDVATDVIANLGTDTAAAREGPLSSIGDTMRAIKVSGTSRASCDNQGKPNPMQRAVSSSSKMSEGSRKQKVPKLSSGKLLEAANKVGNASAQRSSADSPFEAESEPKHAVHSAPEASKFQSQDKKDKDATSRGSRSSSKSLSDEKGAGKLYKQAADVAIGVSAASASVVLADESSFSLNEAAEPTLYSRIANFATGVEADVASGVSASIVPSKSGNIADSDTLCLTSPAFVHTAQNDVELMRCNLSSASQREQLVGENSMHGSSVSGGEILHASPYAEATHVATRVAVAAGGVSPDVSMHGSVASAETHARSISLRGMSAAPDISDISSAGASSISFGDDASVHRHSWVAARSAAHASDDTSQRSSISLKAPSTHSRYARAVRVATGVVAASGSAALGHASPGEGSSAGASSISFGDDLSVRSIRRSPARSPHRSPHRRGVVLTPRAGVDRDEADKLLAHAVAAIPSTGLVRSASWRLRSRRSGSLRGHAPRGTRSAHAGNVHENSRRGGSKHSASSYAQSVATGILESVSGAPAPEGQTDAAGQHSKDSANSSASEREAAKQKENAKLRASHRLITNPASPHMLNSPESRSVRNSSDSQRSPMHGAHDNTGHPNEGKMPVRNDSDACMESMRDSDLGSEQDEEHAMSSELVFAPPCPPSSPPPGGHNEGSSPVAIKGEGSSKQQGPRSNGKADGGGGGGGDGGANSGSSSHAALFESLSPGSAQEEKRMLAAALEMSRTEGSSPAVHSAVWGTATDKRTAQGNEEATAAGSRSRGAQRLEAARRKKRQLKEQQVELYKGSHTPAKSSATESDLPAGSKFVSSTDEASGSLYEDAQEPSRTALRDAANHHDAHCQDESCSMLQEDSRSVSRSDYSERTPRESTPRSEDLESRSPRSKLVRQCQLTLSELEMGGALQEEEFGAPMLYSPDGVNHGVNSQCERESLKSAKSDRSHSSGSKHSSSKNKASSTSGSRWWKNVVSTRMRPKHATRRSAGIGEGVHNSQESDATFEAPLHNASAACEWEIPMEAGTRGAQWQQQWLALQESAMHDDMPGHCRPGIERRRRQRGAVAEAALTSRHPEACMQRAPSFDFCLDLTPDDDSCTPCIYPSDRIPGKASHEHATDAEWHAMVGQIPQAVGEAYSDSEGEGSAGTGPELFREEGEGRPQGPDVPEGAVAGVVVVQPDGSPCIGWLMAHPAIKNLSDTMRQALVKLNLVHARDLELQTRIACDDDRILQAIVQCDRAATGASPTDNDTPSTERSSSPSPPQRVIPTPASLATPATSSPSSSSATPPPVHGTPTKPPAPSQAGPREPQQQQVQQEQAEVEEEDWLTRMRRRDAALQARIAKHDADVYGRRD